ncbi:MAG: hypothetical protein ACKOAD_07215 [Gammaproteobacteria bacterium]
MPKKDQDADKEFQNVLAQLHQGVLDLDLVASHGTLKEVNVLLLLKALKYNNKIKSLLIEDNQLSGYLLKNILYYLVSSPYLETLDCSGNPIEKISLKIILEIISKNNRLNYLRLNNCFLTPEMVEALALVLTSNRTIKTLDLSSNQVGEKGLLALENMLKKNKTIKKLNLSCCFLGNKEIKSFVNSLKTNTTLKALDLSWNRMTMPYLWELSEAVLSSYIDDLNLEYNDLKDDKNTTTKLVMMNIRVQNTSKFSIETLSSLPSPLLRQYQQSMSPRKRKSDSDLDIPLILEENSDEKKGFLSDDTMLKKKEECVIS